MTEDYWIMKLAGIFDRVRVGYVEFKKPDPTKEYSETENHLSDVQFCDHIADANVVTSKFNFSDDIHIPIIDIDVPIHSVPSTTPGHYHLYIDKQLTWQKYRFLLWALMQCGLVERGYYQASVKREMTVCRLPWVKKMPPKSLRDCQCELCLKGRRADQRGRS